MLRSIIVKTLLSKLLVGVILLTSLFLISSTVLAAPYAPYFSYSGSFDYTATDNELSIKIDTISSLYYTDGPCLTFPPFNCTDDLIGGWFRIGIQVDSGDSKYPRGGNIFNGGEDSMVFGSSVGGTGNMTFEVFDKNNNTVLTAFVDDFTVVQDGSTYEVNVGSNLNNVKGINTYPGNTNSRFIDDISSPSNHWNWGDLYMQFTFGGTTAKDFTEDQSGSVTGSFSVTPEPVSSILFITGGATLAFRHFRRKRSK